MRAVPHPKKWRFKFLNAPEKTHFFQSCHIAFSPSAQVVEQALNGSDFASPRPIFANANIV